MIDEQNFFNQPVKHKLTTYDSIQKMATDQRDYYTTGCFLDYNYFKNYYKIIAIDDSKVNNKHLMMIQKQYNKLILREIQVNKQHYFSLLRKRKKLFQIFHKKL